MTATPPRRRTGAAGVRRRLQVTVPLLLAIASVAGLAVACSPNGTATPAFSSPPTSESPGSPKPKPTTWPTMTVEAAIALGAADNDFTKMAMDVVAAVGSEDPGRILTVMNGALEFLAGNQKNVPRLQAYDFTKAVGDRLADAYATMIDGATTARDGLLAGNAVALEAGLTTFFDGNAAYVAISPDLGDLADQAIFMKRVYLK